MTVLLWWILASLAVSLLVGAFLWFGSREAEPHDTIDLDELSAQETARTRARQTPGASRRPDTA